MIAALQPWLGVSARESEKITRDSAHPFWSRSSRRPLADVLAQSRLPGLDGLRAAGVFAVIIAHARITRGLPGDFGPTAFFVLSGFLITRLLQRERKRTGTVSIPRFYLGRTLRIFPAYYVFLLFSYVMDARAHQRWTTAFLANAVTYTMNYFNAFNHHPTTSIAHAWSLAVEEQFYILWPLVFVVLAARGTRALVTGVSLAAAAGIAWRCWLLLGANVDASYVYNAFETRFDGLAVGCLLAIAVDQSSIVTLAERCAARSWYSLVTLGLLLMSRTVLPGAFHYSIGFTVDALLVGLLIVQILQLYQSRFWRWLEWPATRYIGAISYPMYLYHAWGASIGRRVPGNFLYIKFAGGVIATIALASISYYIIERPILRLKPRRQQPRAEVLPEIHPERVVVLPPGAGLRSEIQRKATVLT